MNNLVLRANKFTGTKTFFLSVFAVSVLVMFQRRPYVLAYANFWAEDGRIFFPQMYHDGIKSLLYPYAGYLHLVPRLVMLLTLPFGVINAPFISNLMSLVLRALPMLFLFSERFSFMGIACRFFLWVYCLIMPNALETIGNITNIQWSLSIWLLMVMIADPPKTLAQKFHDWLVLIFAGLSGPFIIFIVPVIIVREASKGKSIAFRIFAVLMAAIQLYTVLNTAQEVHSISLPNTVSDVWEFSIWLMRVFCTRVVYGAFLPIPRVAAYVLNKSVILSVVVFIACILTIVSGFTKGTWRFRVCSLFGAAVFLASLCKEWLLLLVIGGGSRYFVLCEILVFSFVIFFVRNLWLSNNEQVMKKCCIYISALLFIMALLSFSLFHPLKHLEYRQSIREMFYPAKSGSSVVIPINPDGWYMTLIKK